MSDIMMLTIDDIERFRRETWVLYASQSYKHKLLRLYVNCIEQYRVTYGDDVLYEGTDVSAAYAAWRAA